MKEKGANNLRITKDVYYVNNNGTTYPKKLTVEQIRAYSDFKNISDEKAMEIINSLYQLSITTYKIYKENELGAI